jgi:RecB family endonuclease NucS
VTRWTQEQYEAYIVAKGRHPEDVDKPDSGKESRLQSKCEKWLKQHGFPFVHDRSRKKNTRGIPDLICFLPEGRTVIIELKAERGKPTPEQTQMLRMLKYLKHEVYIIRAYKRFIEVMKEHGGDTHL